MSYMESVLSCSLCIPFYGGLILGQSDFVRSRAGTEAKDALVKAVFGYA